MKGAVAIVWLCAVTLALAVLVRGPKVSAFTPRPFPVVRPAIINGTKADPARYPYFASVVSLMDNNAPFCGGVLVNKTTVLTAAHCLGSGAIPADKLPLFLRFLAVRIGLSEERRIRDVKFHPMMDLAMITLTTPSTKQPIALATSLPPNNTPVTVLGQGLKDPSKTGNLAFEKAQLTYMDAQSILKLLEKEPNIDPETKDLLRGEIQQPAELQAVGIRGKSVCNGDSGGPLIIEKSLGQDQLLGLVSWSPATSKGDCGIGMLKTMQSFSSIPYALKSGWPWTTRGRACPGCDRISLWNEYE